MASLRNSGQLPHPTRARESAPECRSKATARTRTCRRSPGSCTIEEAREAGPERRGVRPPAEAVPLRLQAAARDPHRPDHRRADLRAEDRRSRTTPTCAPSTSQALRDARRRDARAAAGAGGRAAPGAGGLLRRDPRRADDGGAARRRLRDGAARARRRARAAHRADTNPLTDAPSVRVCRFARLELDDMIDVRHAVRSPRLVDADARAAMAALAASCSTTASPPPAGSTAPTSRRRRALDAAATRRSPTSTTRSRSATSGSTDP